MLEYLGDGRLELYDLSTDLGETKNLAGEMPEKAAELIEKLHAWQDETNAGKVALNPDFKEN
jgi:hypothetical protein